MAKLNAAQRRAIPKKQFGLPSRAPGAGSYPMPDKGHVISALRLLHNASPAEQTTIRAKAHSLFPGIAQAGRMHSLSSMRA